MLLLAAVPLFAADWLLPLGGASSWVLAAVISLLVVVWSILMWRADRMVPAAMSAAGRDGRRHVIRSHMFHFGAMLLMASFLFAKWTVVLDAQENPELFVGSSRSYSLAIFVVFAWASWVAASGWRAS